MVVTPYYLPVIFALALAGCATPAPQARPAPSADPPPQVAAPRPAPSAPATVALYMPAGSKQCSGGGKSLDAAKRELTDAGVQVLSAQCGTDGQVYASSCGMPDGGILIVKVTDKQLPVAWRMGWRMLTDFPDAKVRECR